MSVVCLKDILLEVLERVQTHLACKAHSYVSSIPTVTWHG